MIIKKIIPQKIVELILTKRKAILQKKLEVAREKELNEFMLNWDLACKTAVYQDRNNPAKSLLIYPSDPSEIIGAVGDDAMISASIENFTREYGDLTISVFCKPGPAEDIVRSRGWEPIPIPILGVFPKVLNDLFSSRKFDVLVILGADVMDGYYSGIFSKQIIAAADIAAKSGIRCIILGFSFNASPDPTLSTCFARLDERVSLNVRDSISFERLKIFSPVKARLVADSAFTLKPSNIDGETQEWILNEKKNGRIVIGLNIHPMLVKNSNNTQVLRMVENMANAINAVSINHHASWMLIPHDYRDESGDGDGICLRPLIDLLNASPNIHCRYFEGKHRASTLKALTSHLDGVITGRMHLAIAALGMGVPVLCLTYQDKFEGLFNHFAISNDYLLPPKSIENNLILQLKIESFLVNLPKLKMQIEQKRQQIIEISELNFSADNII